MTAQQRRFTGYAKSSPQSDGAIHPGKGASIDLTQDTINFLRETLEFIDRNYSDELHDEHPENVLNAILEADGEELWKDESDDYGDKVYTFMTTSSNRAGEARGGQLRVTVVMKRGELKLDIREWGAWGQSKGNRR